MRVILQRGIPSSCDTLKEALAESELVADQPRAFRKPATSEEEHKVLSVQRLRLPQGRDAEWAAEMYLRWLPSSMGPLIPLRVQRDEESLRFRLFSWGLARKVFFSCTSRTKIVLFFDLPRPPPPVAPPRPA